MLNTEKMLSIDQKLAELSNQQLRTIIESVMKDCGESAVTVVSKHLALFTPVATANPIGDAETARDPSTSDLLVSKKVKKQSNNHDKFDINNFHQRQIALQIQYDGASYFGFASQAEEETVEKHFFAALIKLKLIQDRKSCNYSRCGRTDRGVSALGQTVSCKLRSSLPKPVEGVDSTTINSNTKEMDYCTMLNNCLPEEIRIIGWCEVTPDFSSRFSCGYRQYRYFFTKRDLDVGAMQQAAELLVGTHDFRNLCKIDTANVSNFVREIFNAEVKLYLKNEDEDKEVWMLEIKGIAFLWHMVRCIMSILFLVGEKHENPSIITQLLDIASCPAKPTYMMAPELPLVLNLCGYDNLVLSFQCKNLWSLVAHYEALWDRFTIAANRVRNSLEFVKNCMVERSDFETWAVELKNKHAKQNNKGSTKNTTTTTVNTTAVVEGVTTSAGEKRKREEVDEEGQNTETEIFNASPTLLPFHQVLTSVFNSTGGLRPKVLTVPYVPLMQRKKEDCYLDKVNSLTGGKKDRLERHKQISSEVAAETPEFFKRMRAQGNI